MHRRLGNLITALGVLTILVGILHFVMMPELLGLIAAHGGPEAATLIVPMFYINHIGSGVFLLVLGLLIAIIGRRGIRRGEKWAAWSAVIFGAGILTLPLLFWATLPPFFLHARYFEVALISLAAVGLLTVASIGANWRSFHD